MKKFWIILVFLTVSCGFKPIYLSNEQLILEFNKIVTTGNEKINRQIIDNIGLKNNLSSDLVLTLQTFYKIEETSKNTKGQTETYRSIINSQLVIMKDKKIIKDKNFLNEFSYNNKENKFELTKYQNEIKKNLIKELSEEVILFLKLL